MRTTHIFLLSMLSYFSVLGSASDIYLFLDPTCMDRYEYQTVVKSGQGMSQSDYYTYHIKINNSERVVLNTKGTENNLASIPAGTKYCGDMVISESFARQINNRKNRIFLVTQSNSGYTILDIHSADYFVTTDSEMGYSTNEYSFTYDYSTRNKANLANKGSRGKVYYMDRDDNFCPSKYQFRRTPNKNHDPYNDITVVPDIGITEKKTGLDAANANNNVLSLKAVNGIPIIKYMDAVCNGYVEYLAKDMKAPSSTRVVSSGTTTYPSTGTTTTTATGNFGTTYPSGTNTTTGSTPVYTSVCSHIYKDLERGFYYNRNTGDKANETCGGKNYVNGLVPGEYVSADNNGTSTSSTSTVVTTPPVTSTSTVVTAPTTTTTHASTGHVSQSECGHIYKDLDKGFYYNKDTGLKANEECGGIVYKDGLMTNQRSYSSSSSSVVTSTPAPAATVQPETTTTYPTTSYPSTSSMPSTTTTYPSTSSSSSTYTPSTTTSSPVVSTNLVHVVSQKETLYSIAKRYGVTLSDLRSWNSLTNTDLISPGMTLKLSQPSAPYYARTTSPTAATSHVVKKRETLFSIAKKYGLTVAQLKSYNGLSNDVLSIGQKLMLNPYQSSISTPAPASTVVTTSSAPVVSSSSTIVSSAPVVSSTVTSSSVPVPYETVVTTPSTTETVDDFTSKGVTSYSTTTTSMVADTRSSNINSTPGTAFVQKDKYNHKDVADHLNAYGKGRLVHMVEGSETLFSISRKYGVSVTDLRKINNLDKNEIIIPNQKLFITK